MPYKVVYNSCYGGFSLSKEAANWLIAAGSKYVEQYEGYDYVSWTGLRHDPLLIKCVEELGPKVNGICSCLEIIEIKQPQYTIDEYDGRETVKEFYADYYDARIME